MHGPGQISVLLFASDFRFRRVLITDSGDVKTESYIERQEKARTQAVEPRPMQLLQRRSVQAVPCGVMRCKEEIAISHAVLELSEAQFGNARKRQRCARALADTNTCYACGTSVMPPLMATPRPSLPRAARARAARACLSATTRRLAAAVPARAATAGCSAASSKAMRGPAAPAPTSRPRTPGHSVHTRSRAASGAPGGATARRAATRRRRPSRGVRDAAQQHPIPQPERRNSVDKYHARRNRSHNQHPARRQTSGVAVCRAKDCL